MSKAANGPITIVSNGISYQIRPAPLVSISQTARSNNIGKFASEYNITLNGFILTDQTSISGIGQSAIQPDGRLDYHLAHQNNLRKIFDASKLRIEIGDSGNNPVVSFDTRLESIQFEEGTYVDVSRYTINLVANSGSGYILGLANVSGVNNISDFTDTWSFEIDESFGRPDSNNNIIPRSYIFTRNTSAVGITPIDFSSSGTPPWKYADSFVKNIASDHLDSSIVSGFLGLTNFYGYNHSRVSTIDKSAGSASITDTWYVASGNTTNALESYNLSINSSADNPYIKVSIDGTIKGLTPASGGWTSGSYASGNNLVNRPYSYAYKHFYGISNSGNYGIASKIYKRANNAISDTLNATPLNVSLGLNEANGEITYNIEFDNRPSNYFSDAIYESITVNDTYPGDVFATIPVLGRPTGPILQYTFGRTEFRRDISIEILLDNTDIGYDLSVTPRNKLLLTKPSLSGRSRGALNTLITELSPASEPGIRKYFLSPPQESWHPKDGRYTLNLSWTYELDR